MVSTVRSPARAARLLGLLLAAIPLLAQGGNEIPGVSIRGFTEQIGSLEVTVGPVRLVARQARTPLVSAFSDGTLVVTGGNPLVSTDIRSEDRGGTWSENPIAFGFLNTAERSDGTLLVLDYQPVADGNQGVYRTRRWISSDRGRTLQGPFPGRMRLPTSVVSPSAVTWFNQIAEDDTGALLAVAQSQELPGHLNAPWKVILLRSTDGGRRFDYVATVVDQTTIVDPGGALSENDWPLYWAIEPSLADLGGGQLVVVVRTVNDEHPLDLLPSHIGPPMESYGDLQHAVRGDGIYPGLGLGLDPDKWYGLGPPSAPLVIATSSDGGETWSSGRPLPGPRGVFPRLAWDGAGILALTYGGLSGVPRHGNAISFSLDGGVTWEGEVDFGPFLTTGYTGLVVQGPGRFLTFFDATPPQPWTRHEQWWIGVREITVGIGGPATDPD